jgi:hypothetical protein
MVVLGDVALVDLGQPAQEGRGDFETGPCLAYITL